MRRPGFRRIGARAQRHFRRGAAKPARYRIAGSLRRAEGGLRVHRRREERRGELSAGPVGPRSGGCGLLPGLALRCARHPEKDFADCGAGRVPPCGGERSPCGSRAHPDQSPDGADRRSAPRLTPREKQIVHQICEGLKNKEIAEALSITAGTVKVHLMHIFEKTGVKDRFELAIQGRKLLGLDSSAIPKMGPGSENLPGTRAKVHAPAGRITRE